MLRPIKAITQVEQLLADGNREGARAVLRANGWTLAHNDYALLVAAEKAAPHQSAAVIADARCAGCPLQFAIKQSGIDQRMHSFLADTETSLSRMTREGVAACLKLATTTVLLALPDPVKNEVLLQALFNIAADRLETP